MFSSKTKTMIEKHVYIEVTPGEQRKRLFRWEHGRAYLYIEPVTPGEQGKWEELGPEDIRYTILYRSDDGYVHGPWREGYPSDVLIKHMQVHWRSPVSLDEDGFGYESGVLVQEKIDFAKRIVHYGVEEQKRMYEWNFEIFEPCCPDSWQQFRWQQFIDEKKNKKPSWPMPRRRW